MSHSVPITVAYGNGIGPELMKSVLDILKAANANISPEIIEIGESIYNKGISTGIEDASWESIYKNKIFLKAPITTPQGGGFRSLNVTIRKRLGLYANIRPCVSYHPFVPTNHLYTGIEYQQTNEVVQCLKLISKSGSRRIIQYAFEYALHNNRKKVTCFTKDNIMKRTDGLFRKIFEEVGQNYPKIEKEHWIVDIGAAKLATSPKDFDVVVLPNLYGDILSDVAAQVSGSIGMAGSANIGDKYAMFEAIHGSAPRRAGQNMANPSGLLQGAILMLLHIGQTKPAEVIQNSWLKTLEDGIHTYDIYQKDLSKQKVNTTEFTQAIIDRFGENPIKLKPVSYNQKNTSHKQNTFHHEKKEEKTLVGVDVFIDNSKTSIKNLAQIMQKIAQPPLQLTAIYSRGLNVWPLHSSNVLLSDYWRCRFMHSNSEKQIDLSDIVHLLSSMQRHQIDFTQTEHLYLFDGTPGFSSN